MKRCRLTLLLILFFIVGGYTTLKSQNNVYKINDELYKYYQKVSMNLHKKEVGLKMTDTLFIRAKHCNDLKAQCMALYLRVSYYSKCGDYIKEKEELKKIAPFIQKTPYHQYLFSAWAIIIIGEINRNEYAAATLELSRMQTEAKRLKNDFGIKRSISLLGDFYYSLGLHYLSCNYSANPKHAFFFR
jgi:hypothetical protein